MVEVLLRRGRRADDGRLAAAALDYAAMGWPVVAGAHLLPGPGRHLRPTRGTARAAGRACSCDRVGCPAPGAHPVSPAWQMEATTAVAEVGRIWRERPAATIILVTGRVFDVLDVPVLAGSVALARMDADGAPYGPVAFTADDRALFFVATRGAPEDEDEWWSCGLDCDPGTFEPVAGLRWHTRDSYVVGPPSGTGRLATSSWVRDPAGHALPDALRPLEYLADACDEAPR